MTSTLVSTVPLNCHCQVVPGAGCHRKIPLLLPLEPEDEELEEEDDDDVDDDAAPELLLLLEVPASLPLEDWVQQARTSARHTPPTRAYALFTWTVLLVWVSPHRFS